MTSRDGAAEPTIESARLGLAPEPPEHLPRTLGELLASGWTSRSVADELRANAVDRLRAGVPLVPGVIGYEDTVLPQLANALLAGHDLILLGERGQAKTRIIRALVGLLDEWLPVVAGSELSDDPTAPVSPGAVSTVAEAGDDTPIEWLHRSDRFAEKLATPDTSIADLIGEVDPIKVAEGRHLDDEGTIHFGLVPRANRGIFAINELPDLSERIQVGLLNVLEERDVQIRGYRIRLPLDVMLIASANPEDYTNRGRLITPLKDRFGAQIRTHYPLEVATEVDILAQEARLPAAEGVTVTVPRAMADVVATFSHLARQSSQVSQRSGVSVRLTVTNYETMAANALRRALRLGEEEAAPRVCDLDALPASTMGKVEIESLEEGRGGQIVEALWHHAVLTVFRELVSPGDLGRVVDEVEQLGSVEVGDEVSLAEFTELLSGAPELTKVAASVAGDAAAAAELASAAELVLEGLHLSKRLNKDALGAATTYTGRRG
ncbi:MAG: sigma 54-interacting transcriptional regulator [Microthrixaceae bacterium]